MPPDGCRDCGGPKDPEFPRRWYCDACRDRRDQAAHFRQRYGITVEEYEALNKAQGGVCAVCKKPPQRPRGRRNRHLPPKRLAVDHDHRTGAVRGLCCSFCNHRLLGVTDDPVILRAAADYLDNPPARLVLAQGK